MALGPSKKMLGGLLLVCLTLASAQNCQIPRYYRGDWYSWEQGEDVQVLINQDSWGGLNCYDIRNTNGSVSSDDLESRILLVDPASECFYCHYAFYRTPNILQYRKSACATRTQGMAPELESLCGNRPVAEELTTQYRTEPVNVNCKRTFEGVYHFSYEKQEGQGGICETQANTIYACQPPGSPYVDNQVFYLNYGKCPNVSTSREQRIRYQCMGTWAGENGYTYAGIANTVERNPRERFKCLLTRPDQRPADNKYRWVRSRFSDCLNLHSTYAGYERLVVSPIPRTSTDTTPVCNLPRNLTGTWLIMGEADTQVRINETHIMMKQKTGEYTYQETYFSCQQTNGTRYLMAAITVGRCEVDFICWDIVPRHHSIVRYRTGHRNRLTEDDKVNPNYLEIKFRQACDSLSFTDDENGTDRKYGVLISDPPNPVPCPIGGRYRFLQNAHNNSDLITTRVTSVTESPRVKVDCGNVQSEFKSCIEDMTKIEIDAEYCEPVDSNGRPIGEHDEPDRILTCVGYWMEDMKSYLMTYDEEDAISKYRCWVYKRINTTEIVLSRSAQATCGANQEATSYSPDEGASLSLELSENERLFDTCPQRYDDGYNPYRKPFANYLIAGSHRLTCYLPLMGTLFCTMFSFFLR